ncbi:MAG: hypothetical protein ACI8X5_003259 [Planctomycetota bacterium]|jgi:hypothetical protein
MSTLNHSGAIQTRRALSVLLLVLPFSNASAQRGGFSSPGSLRNTDFSQTTRFDNAFNPAISLMLDLIGDYRSYSGDTKDGADLSLRRLDLLIADWVDPSTLLWTTIAYEGDEIVVDEAALEYIELPGNQSLRAGRFFIDFGKQMQAHVEELRTIDRPLVLRSYLGEELAGDGVQWDNWTSFGEATLLRYSAGAYMNLSGGGHGHDDEEDSGPELHVSDRHAGEDLGFAGRLTAMTETGSNGILQFGTSIRLSSDFAFEDDTSGVEVSGMRNVVYGLDLTYGEIADDGIHQWSSGAEILLNDGDLSAELNDGGTPGNPADDSIDVHNGSALGGFVYFDRQWSQAESAGGQFSWIQEPEPGKPREEQYDLYYTRHLSEFLRIRFGIGYVNSTDEPDSAYAAIQFTGFIGAHGHGLNW